uniref:PdxS/SNZ N-terminal domain-containing protein n=1 Tax=Oryza punctata TaxID=4537 RepID=A0A0E0LVD7_ORYPU
MQQEQGGHGLQWQRRAITTFHVHEPLVQQGALGRCTMCIAWRPAWLTRTTVPTQRTPGSSAAAATSSRYSTGIREDAAMIRTKGEAITYNIRHVCSVRSDIRTLQNMNDDEVFSYVKCIATPTTLSCRPTGEVVTPADMMQLGCDGVFVGSGVFKSVGIAAACDCTTPRRTWQQATHSPNHPHRLELGGIEMENRSIVDAHLDPASLLLDLRSSLDFNLNDFCGVLYALRNATSFLLALLISVIVSCLLDHLCCALVPLPTIAAGYVSSMARLCQHVTEEMDAIANDHFSNDDIMMYEFWQTRADIESLKVELDRVVATGYDDLEEMAERAKLVKGWF